MGHGATKTKTTPVMKMKTPWKNPELPSEKKPGEEAAHDAEYGRPGVPAEERVGQADEGVQPDAEGEPDAEDHQRHLDDDVGHGPPPHPVAQRRLEPSEEPGTGDEGFGVVDVSPRRPGPGPVEAPDAPGPPERDADDDETDEGDGQDDAGDHGDDDEGQAERRPGRREEEVDQLGPGPPLEWLPPGAGRSCICSTRALEMTITFSLPPDAAGAVPVGPAPHHASRRAMSAAPRARTTAHTRPSGRTPPGPRARLPWATAGQRVGHAERVKRTRSPGDFVENEEGRKVTPT